MIPIIGLIGEIGSGKSTVANIFRDLNCGVISADLFSHEIVYDNEVKSKITEILHEDVYTKESPAFPHESCFGNFVLKKIDKIRLRKLIMEDPSKLDRIQNIIHPLVQEYVDEETKYYRSRDSIQAVIWDIPLLIEVGWQHLCDALVFITVNEQNQLDRVVKRGWDIEYLNFLKNRQFPMREKIAIVENFPIGYGLSNNGTEEELSNSIKEFVFPGILREYRNILRNNDDKIH